METLMIIIGWTASLMSLASSLPQTIRTYTKRTGEGVSITMLLLSWLGIFLLILYCGITSTLIGGVLNSVNIFLFWISFSLVIKYKEIKHWKIISFIMFALSALFVIGFIYFMARKIHYENDALKWISISLASCLIAFCFIPQVITTLKSKNVIGLSISFFLFKAFGNILWGIYWTNIAVEGLEYSAFIALACNIFIILICSAQAWLTFYYRRNNYINILDQEIETLQYED